MIIAKTALYTSLTLDGNSIENFLSEFSKKNNEFKNQHLIIDISCKNNVTIQELLLFLTVNSETKDNGMSFVIVSTQTYMDQLPEELIVVPTFTEAEDILQMEAIERELGF